MFIVSYNQVANYFFAWYSDAVVTTKHCDTRQACVDHAQDVDLLLVEAFELMPAPNR